MGATEVIGTRVSDGYKQRFADMCVKAGATPREIIENLVDDYFACKFEMNGGHIESGLLTGISEDFDDSVNNESEYKEFGFDTLVNLLRKKEYPDEYIKKMADSMIATAYDMPKFNPRKMRSDECGC